MLHNVSDDYDLKGNPTDTGMTVPFIAVVVIPIAIVMLISWLI